MFLFLVATLVLANVAAFAGNQTFVNDTGKTAIGITITFSTQTLITWNGGPFSDQNPDGMSESFTFSGGNVDFGAGFMISWGPDSATVVGYQWLTGDTTISTPPQTNIDLPVGQQNSKPFIYERLEPIITDDEGLLFQVRVIDPISQRGIEAVTIRLGNPTTQELIFETATDISGNGNLRCVSNYSGPYELVLLDETASGIGNYFDRIETIECIAGGDTFVIALIPNIRIEDSDLRERYSTFNELLARATGSALSSVTDSPVAIGTSDPLIKNWGSGIKVYNPPDPDKHDRYVKRVLHEFNIAYGSDFFTYTGRLDDADWVMNLVGVDWRKERALNYNISFDSTGHPSKLRLNLVGYFHHAHDIETRLRYAIAEALLLNKDFDDGLIWRGERDSNNFRVTEFSNDFVNLVKVISALGYGRDLSGDLNEANLFPIANAGPDLEAKVGDRITLDASQSLDPDGSIVSICWEQIFPSARDDEYMTNNPADLSDSHGAQVSFSPEWPGNYRFKLIVKDNEGQENETFIDVGVRWGSNPFEILGTNSYGHWEKDGLNYWIKNIGARCQIFAFGVFRPGSRSEATFAYKQASDRPTDRLLLTSEIRPDFS